MGGGSCCWVRLGLGDPSGCWREETEREEGSWSGMQVRGGGGAGANPGTEGWGRNLAACLCPSLGFPLVQSLPGESLSFSLVSGCPRD